MMKTTWLTLALTAIHLVAFAQGKVSFGNDADHLIMIEDPWQYPVRWIAAPQIGTPGDVMSSLTAELYAGGSPSSLTPQYTMTPAGRAGLPDGRLDNAAVILTNIPAGITAYFQVRILDLETSTPRGQSPVFTAVPGSFAYTPLAASTTWPDEPILLDGCLTGLLYFLEEPRSQVELPGGTVTFSVRVAACPFPAYFQWRFNGAPIPGATQSRYQIINVQPENAGDYSVEVRNQWRWPLPGDAWHYITSSNATLTVPVEPMITFPPQGQTAMVGRFADLTVGAEGVPPLAYQWFFNSSVVSGANGRELYLTNLQFSHAGAYTVVITNTFGAVTSPPAVLTVVAVSNPPAGRVVGWGEYVIPYAGPSTRFAAIAAATYHGLALRSDGTVVGWGWNQSGQITSPPGLTGVTAVAAGISYSLALKNDDTVVAWGNNTYGQTSVPVNLAGVMAIAAGANHSLALKSGGTVAAWGDNSSNQTNVPAGLSGVVAIAAGAHHSLALKSDGTVVAWGAGVPGQSGVPAGLSGVIAISGGQAHSLALKSDGTVIAWGDNRFGQTNVPAGLSGIIAIAAGTWHSMALKSDGTVVAWGDNTWGESTVPANLNGVIALAGNSCSLALKSDGTIVAWGNNYYGQCMVPAGLAGVTATAAAWQHSVALKSDGTIVAWGRNEEHQTAVPVGLKNVTAIAAGDFHCLALKSDGTIVAWGDRSHGQTNVPAGLHGVIAIAAGGSHNLALKSDRTVVAWGYNSHGQTNVPTDLHGVIAIAAGGSHSLALRSDGTIVGWGNNADGQTEFTYIGGVVAVAAGGSHSLALRSVGTVVARGRNTQGQSSVPTGLRGVTAIAAGGHHSLALKSDGTVVAWGYNSDGQTNVPTDLHGVISIAAGAAFNLAVGLDPPIIKTPPTSQTAEAGSAIEFHMCAGGDPGLTYRWYFNSATAPVATTTNGTLLLSSNVQPSHAGAYIVVISNFAGCLTSAPILLSVIPPVERRWVPGLTLTGQPGNALNLEATDELVPAPSWAAFDSVLLANPSQWYFDLSEPLPPQRLFRAWQSGVPAAPVLNAYLIPALTLTGLVGSTVRVDGINQFGPTDAWFPLATVTLTNTSQLYFDVSVIGQPRRLWRLVQVP